MSCALRPFLLISLPLYLLDQITKFWVVFEFRPPRFETIEGVTYLVDIDSRPVIDGFFNLTRVHNTGVAFGFGNGTSWAPVVFLLVPVLALLGIVWYWRRGGFQGFAGVAAATLLVAGICGNVTDRLVQGFFADQLKGAGLWAKFSGGYVVDFLDFTIPLIDYRWPSFNVADSCICVAAVFFFFAGVQNKDETETKSTSDPCP